MASTRKIKLVLLLAVSVGCALWLLSGSISKAVAVSPVSPGVDSETAFSTGDDYVGSETCKACHEDQFKAFDKTKHAKLPTIASWKDKAKGCESCHGPGSKHVEDPTVKGSIISFVNKNSKTIAETCLACHAGKESHNNFRRGEHWRNNVGCTDCHSVHGPDQPKLAQGSITFTGRASELRPNQVDRAQLKQSEPQLCMTCHNETKAQFTKPFHHKVLEGTMNCSDCHNPHGGFEAKQQRLAVGADAACVRCHTNKQGPFVFEHAPLKIEGCSACHTPHGSANPKMLKRSSVRQLCLECHSSITEQLASDVPSFHNQTGSGGKYQNCTTCHAAIHGSNAHKAFFR
jgi:predicted CXXCH cytochrome family protein